MRSTTSSLRYDGLEYWLEIKKDGEFRDELFLRVGESRDSGGNGFPVKDLLDAWSAGYGLKSRKKKMKFGPALVKLRDRLVAIYPLETFPATGSRIPANINFHGGKPKPPTS